MLLDSVDMADGDWKVVDERAYRMRRSGAESDEIRRARENGGIEVTRCLMLQTPRRSVTIAMAPYASAKDARSHLPNALDRVIRKPLSKSRVSHEGMIEDQEIPGVLNPVIYEFLGTTSTGDPTSTRLVFCAVSEMFITFDFSAVGEAWSDKEVKAIAATQVEKIRRLVASDTSGVI
jgi:hypothetical protein